MAEQNRFPETRKKREEGRQAPEPEPEPPGTRKSWWNRTPFRRKEKRETKGNKHLNPSRNQKGPGHHDGTEPLSEEKKERRRETSTGTPAGTRKQHHKLTPETSKKKAEGRQAPEPQPEPGGTRTMMEQTPFPQKGKKREEERQAPAPEPEPRRARTS